MTEKGKHILRIITGALAITVATGTLAAAYGGMVDPVRTPLPAILAMTFPAWILLSAALAIVLCLIRTLRKIAIIPLAALIASAGPIMAYSPINPHSVRNRNETAGNGTFTVMSFNVFELNDIKSGPRSPDKRQWQREVDAGMTNPTINYLLDENADLLLLQEFPLIRVSNRVHFTEQQVDSINSLYPFSTYKHSEAILSKQELHPVTLRQPESPYAWFTAAKTNIMGHETLLVSVHLQSIGLNRDDKELYHDLTAGDAGKKNIQAARHQLIGKLANAFRQRASQAKLLREQIDSIGIENVIIGGDFNDIPDCYALRQLCRDDFKNAFTEAGLGPIITYHANRFYFHIDHIVYRGDMEAIGFERGTCPNSDHYPVIATFRWKNS